MIVSYLVKTLIMFIKEYFFSTETGGKNDIRKLFILLTVFMSICLFVTIYLEEQANRNIDLHNEVYKDNREVTLENKRLLEENVLLQNQFKECLYEKSSSN